MCVVGANPGKWDKSFDKSMTLTGTGPAIFRSLEKKNMRAHIIPYFVVSTTFLQELTTVDCMRETSDLRNHRGLLSVDSTAFATIAAKTAVRWGHFQGNSMADSYWTQALARDPVRAWLLGWESPLPEDLLMADNILGASYFSEFFTYSI